MPMSCVPSVAQAPNVPKHKAHASAVRLVHATLFHVDMVFFPFINLCPFG